MFYGGGFVSLIVLALWIYCIIDVVSAEDTLVRNLPKIVWLLLVIFLPPIGSVVWLVAGRPERAGFRPGATNYRRPLRAVAPDDDPQFLARLDDEAKRLRTWEDDLKRREDEMRRREEGDQDPG
ncbi:MAG: PLDc N-terminal domain-containing protein [Actinomycetota bacterium]